MNQKSVAGITQHLALACPFPKPVSGPTDCLSIFCRRTANDHSCEWTFSFWDELETELVWRSGLTFLRLPAVRV